MCIGVQKVPIQWERESYDVREKYLDLHPEYRNYSTGSRALHEEHINIDQVLKFIHGVNYRTCKKWVDISQFKPSKSAIFSLHFHSSFHPQDLILRGDVGYGAKEQFENEAKMAVRLANFVSAFLQVTALLIFAKYLWLIL